MTETGYRREQVAQRSEVDVPLPSRHVQPLLTSIPDWLLTDDEWAEVDTALTDLDRAAAGGSDDDAGAALARLAILGDRARPSRPLQPGLARAEREPSPRTRALADRLVHRLVDPPAPASSDGTR